MMPKMVASRLRRNMGSNNIEKEEQSREISLGSLNPFRDPTLSQHRFMRGVDRLETKNPRGKIRCEINGIYWNDRAVGFQMNGGFTAQMTSVQ